MSKKRILIVEDDDFISTHMQKVLQKYGFDIAGKYTSGQDAIRALVTEDVDLILMDVIIAGQLDGIETAKIIINQYNIPVIFLTAMESPEFVERIKYSNAYGYILKPFNDRELCVSVDMAIQKHELEIKVAESQLWLKTTLNSMGEGLLAIRPDFTVEYINSRAQIITRWQSKDVLGKQINDIFLLQDESNLQYLFLENIVSAMNTDISEKKSYILVRHDSTTVPVDITVSKIYHEVTEETGYVIVFEDISERKEAEKVREDLIIKLQNMIVELEQTNKRLSETQEELIKSEKKTATLAMAVTANHEINQPLMIIRGNKDLIEMKLESFPDINLEKHFNKINNSISRIEDILQKFKDIDIPEYTNYSSNTTMIDINKSTKGETMNNDHPRIIDDPMYKLLREGKIDEFNSRRINGEEVDLKQVNLRGLDLRGMNVEGIDFRDTYFKQTDLRGLNFSKCNLEGCNIQHAKISGTYFPKTISAQEILLSVEFGTRMRNIK